MAKKAATQHESDAMGTIEVPGDVYWGAQTERARADLLTKAEKDAHELNAYEVKSEDLVGLVMQRARAVAGKGTATRRP